VKVSAVGDAVGPLLGDDINATFSMANGVLVRYVSRHPLLTVTRQRRSHRRQSHLCTGSYISLGILYRKYTGARGNGFAARS
jgi:hypothetical protein